MALSKKFDTKLNRDVWYVSGDDPEFDQICDWFLELSDQQVADLLRQLASDCNFTITITDTSGNTL